jgi:amidohydrolase
MEDWFIIFSIQETPGKKVVKIITQEQGEDGIIDMKTEICRLEEKYREKYIGYWKDFHQHPELSFNEIRTSAKVAEILGSMGISVKREVGYTGVTGLLEGAEEGPVIALRADMDALKINERTGCDFASENRGIMHACGHDAHTAMLLGAAHILSEMREGIAGSVKFIFQPAEENSPSGGAAGMIKEGVLENPEVSAVLGLHVWPTLETGQLGIKRGVMSAASDRLKITIKGKSCHAAYPEEGIDAVVIASEVISALQTLISRNVSPLDSAVITIGKLSGGTRYNIVADRVDLDGTVRTFLPETRDMLSRKIEEITRATVESMGGTCEMEYQRGYPAIMNDPGITSILRKTITNLVGSEGLYEVETPDPGGEDFAYFSEKVPSAFVWLGCKPKGISVENFPKVHNNRFLPDEKALNIGVKYFCFSTLDLMNNIEE